MKKINWGTVVSIVVALVVLSVGKYVWSMFFGPTAAQVVEETSAFAGRRAA